MNKRILVTGGAGYIGSHVVRALLAENWQVTVLDNLSSGNRDFVPDSVDFVEADISDSLTVRELIRKKEHSAVIHLAGYVSVEESVNDPLSYYGNNTCASLSFIDSCVKEDIKHFIFSSSAAVYGNPDRVQVSEEVQPNPVSPYGRSKLMTEEMLRDVCSVSDMTSISLRYFNVAGADPDGRCGMVTKNATHLIKVLCETALGIRPKFTIFGDDYDTADGTCIRDFIHVSDLATAHIAALNHLMEGGDCATINCGYGHGFSVREVVDTLQKLIDEPLNVEIGERRAGDIGALIADVQKIRTELDWKPKHDDLSEIVSSSLNWERKWRSLLKQ